MKKKFTHGGARKGSGPKTKKPSKMRRIPVPVIPIVDEIVSNYKSKLAIKKATNQ